MMIINMMSKTLSARKFRELSHEFENDHVKSKQMVELKLLDYVNVDVKYEEEMFHVSIRLKYDEHPEYSIIKHLSVTGSIGWNFVNGIDISRNEDERNYLINDIGQHRIKICLHLRVHKHVDVPDIKLMGMLEV